MKTHHICSVHWITAWINRNWIWHMRFLWIHFIIVASSLVEFSVCRPQRPNIEQKRIFRRENKHDRHAICMLRFQGTHRNRNEYFTIWINFGLRAVSLLWDYYIGIIFISKPYGRPAIFRSAHIDFRDFDSPVLTSRTKISDDGRNSSASNVIRKTNIEVEELVGWRMRMWVVIENGANTRSRMRERKTTGDVGVKRHSIHSNLIAYGIAVELWFHSYAIELCK